MKIIQSYRGNFYFITNFSNLCISNLTIANIFGWILNIINYNYNVLQPKILYINYNALYKLIT